MATGLKFGLIIIGDEILSGRRTDQHFAKLVALLGSRGLQLGRAEIIGDDPARIVATLQRSFASGDTVFCCGGIGATPDDHTRQCAAVALGVPLAMHPEAQASIIERIGDVALAAGQTPLFDSAANLHRLKMAEFPAGAAIIPNPYNKIAGFSIQSHYFVPGFPVMAGPMMEWVLDTHYKESFHQMAHLEQSVLVFDAAEATLTPMMEALEREFAQVKVFSLPNVGDKETRPHIELGVKGEPLQTKAALQKMLAELDRFKLEYASAPMLANARPPSVAGN